MTDLKELLNKKTFRGAKIILGLKVGLSKMGYLDSQMLVGPTNKLENRGSKNIRVGNLEIIYNYDDGREFITIKKDNVEISLKNKDIIELSDYDLIQEILKSI